MRLFSVLELTQAGDDSCEQTSKEMKAMGCEKGTLPAFSLAETPEVRSNPMGNRCPPLHLRRNCKGGGVEIGFETLSSGPTSRRLEKLKERTELGRHCGAPPVS